MAPVASAQLWETPQATVRQEVLKDFSVAGNVLQGPETRVTLDVSGGRVVGVLVEAATGTALARGVAAAWGMREADLPQLVRQLSSSELLASARRGFTEFTDESEQDMITVKVTGQGAQVRWRAYLALKIWPDAAFPATRNVSGRADAPNSIRIFSDFQCPYCRDLWHETLPGWARQTTQYRVAHYHFPLDFHKNAFAAAEASECAAAQGAFWKMADQIFAGFDVWNRLSARDAATQFRTYAGNAKLTPATFEKCMTQRSSRAVVDAQIKAGLTLGVKGTPTVFLNGMKLQNYTDASEWAQVQAVTTAKPSAAQLIESRLAQFR